MNLNERIRKTEIEFPKVFSKVIEKDFGLLFINENNKTSHDSNHAIIYSNKVGDIKSILNNITSFYTEKGITPRIYPPYNNGFLKDYKADLEECGFEIELYDKCQYMLLSGKNNIEHKNKLRIERVTHWDERISTDVYVPNEKEYTIQVIKEALKCKDYHLYVGFIGETAVTTASLYYSDYNCVRLDDVETAIKFRGNGYSRELISFVVNYHNNSSKASFYLSAENPTAIRIYQEAGFRLINAQFESWSGVYNLK